MTANQWIRISDSLEQCGDHLHFYCPGCRMQHGIRVRHDGGAQGPYWHWDGDKTAPTVSPSILVTGVQPLSSLNDPQPLRCHSFLRNGMLEFLNDCTHELAGQTVPLPSIDQEDLDDGR